MQCFDTVKPLQWELAVERGAAKKQSRKEALNRLATWQKELDLGKKLIEKASEKILKGSLLMKQAARYDRVIKTEDEWQEYQWGKFYHVAHEIMAEVDSKIAMEALYDQQSGRFAKVPVDNTPYEEAAHIAFPEAREIYMEGLFNS